MAPPNIFIRDLELFYAATKMISIFSISLKTFLSEKVDKTTVCNLSKLIYPFVTELIFDKKNFTEIRSL